MTATLDLDWREWPLPQKLRLLDRLKYRPTPWTPLPHQLPPPGEGGVDWELWLLLAGRGAGKTDACASYVTRHIQGPPCLDGPAPHRVGLIAPTLGDASKSCVSGPSGLKRHDPSLTGPVVRMGGAMVIWRNGAEGFLFGAHTEDDVDRLRAGGNRCLDWYEELAAWRRLGEALDQAGFGLRSGPHPHVVASTTPKNRPALRQVIADPDTVVTKARTADNPHLPERRKRRLLDKFAGTTLGRQELDADLLEDTEGALWTRALLDLHRVTDMHTSLEDLHTVVVGVDPSGTNTEGADECGIIVAGAARQEDHDHGYVLDDWSGTLSPRQWGRRAVSAALKHDADVIVVESNFGGDMARTVIQVALEEMEAAVKVENVHASRGKQVRAQPVATVTEGGRLHMVGTWPELEDQMATWTPGSPWSPDRLDAAVFAVTRAMRLGKTKRRKVHFTSDEALRDRVAARRGG